MSKKLSLPDQLAQISALVAAANPAAAQGRLQALLLTMGGDELRVYESDIRRTIDTFLPKRRKSLLEQFSRQLSRDPEVPAPATPQPDRVAAPPPEVGQLARALRTGLADLSQYHIFLWSTFYRDFLSSFFSDALQLSKQPSAVRPLAEAVKTELSSHAAEIFAKGFKYVTEAKASPQSVAIGKSLGGLQRFLELPIEFYTARVSTAATLADGRALRTLSSAMLTGILRGYASITFGNQPGKSLIAQNARLWAHYVAFLTEDDFQEIFLDRPEDLLAEFQPVFPLVQALDRVLDSRLTQPALPVLGQLVWDQRRVDVSLRYLSHLLEIQCFLDATYVTTQALQEAAARGASIVLAPGSIETRQATTPQPPVGIHVILTDGSRGDNKAAQSVYDHLELEIFQRIRRKLTSDPLTFNFAREFPLHNPVLAKFFHVYRASVRDLIRTVERRNGVRLWCSVRRSGKTVACFDLADTAGPSTVVSQTSAAIHPLPNATLFQDLVDAALTNGSKLEKGFFPDVVRQCAPSSPPERARFVFVLDEYERLFGTLDTEAKARPELEHRVVFPLLDQMVAFARDNLLVFMGQQPNAYSILTAQNQLSAYVQQDSFPLFTHSGTSGEFADLLRIVLRQMADFDSSFADAVFAETAGHPFLTVKVLVAFVDWLIEENRTLGDLHFTGGDFDSFAAAKLLPEQLGLSSEYNFFHDAIAEAIGTDGRGKDPWLHVVYRSLQRLAQESPSTFRMSRTDFRLLFEELEVNDLSFTADSIIRTATQSNFLDWAQDEVSIKIPLLGRLAAISRQRLAP